MANNEERTSQDRKPRSGETREAATRRQASWRQPGVLPEPEEDDHYDYRWIRASMVGQEDPRNVSMKLREGWEIVDPKEQPDMDLGPAIPGQQSDSGTIAIGGLILCKMPKEFTAQRQEHYDRQNRAQLQAVDQNLMNEQQDKRMPILKPKRETSFGPRD